MEWHEAFKHLRQEYQAQQVEFANFAGIHPKSLSAIENGRKHASEAIRKQLDQTIEIFNPKYELYAVFDYVRIRFPSHNHEELIENILKINFKAFIHETFAFYGYQQQYCFGELSVMVSDSEDERGTLFELKGKGCRFFEEVLLNQDRTWHEFFGECLSKGGILKRIDIAINDTAGILSIPQLCEKMKK